MSGLWAAMTLLTRFPVHGGAWESAGLSWFPLVGAALGVLAALTYALASLALDPLVAAALAIGVLVVVTGGLHEDGLGDTSDALGVRDRGDRLRIMGEPSLGTYGVLALVFSVLLRLAALAQIAPAVAIVGLPAIHALTRAALPPLLVFTPAARQEGMAHWVKARGRRRDALASVLGGMLLAGSLLQWQGAAAALVVAACALLVRAWSLRALGGMNGDTCGAAQQLGETSALIYLAAAL